MPTLLLAIATEPDLAANLLAARLQMALTLGAHITLAVFGVGMPVLLLAAEWRYLRSGDHVWKALAHRWSKVFAVLFAVGAVSGTVLSFELGLLWPEFMSRYGAVIGFPFAMEGFAFFLEAIFVGIYLYGWGRLAPWVHWWCGWPIAISGCASAWFVVTVNSWMNCPRGFTWENGAVVDVDPVAAMLNPCAWPQAVHMIVAAYMVTGFIVAGCYAWRLLRVPNSLYNRRAMALGLLMGAVMTPVQFVVGDWMARTVAATQPVKLAAMEGQFRTQADAPLRIGGLPDTDARETRFALEIPGMLSYLAYHDRQAVVQGLDAFPRHEWPPIPVVHVAFQIMVGIGGLLMLVTAYALVVAIARRTVPQARWFLWLLVACGPLAWLALEAGWVVTEVGRQPWLVHQVARTADLVTHSPYVSWMLAATLTIYALILLGTFSVLRRLGRTPLPEDARGA
ncbi:MAG: cytochrome ubiquinol oxidase subunit I [Pirellulales bacterium]